MRGMSSVVVCGSPEFVTGARDVLPGTAILATFSSARECMRSLPNLTAVGARALVVGPDVSDVTPLNLAGSAARSYSALDVVLVGGFDTGHIPRELSIRTITSLDVLATAHPTPRETPVPTQPRQSDAVKLDRTTAPGRVIVVASARGGVGKTMVASLSAMLAARAGLKTAIFDLDLQFGDIAFTFDRMPEKTLLQISEEMADSDIDASRLGEQVSGNLSIFVPSGSPEHAELVAPHIGAMLHSLRSAFELVVIDTGAFWTLLHAEVLEAADLCLMIIGPRAASVRANSQARELCGKLGIPDAKLVHVMSRVADDGEAGPMDAAANLRIPEVLAIPDGGSEVSALMGIGHPEGLIDSSNPAAASVDELLERVLPAMGLAYSSSLKRPFGSRRKRRW